MTSPSFSEDDFLQAGEEVLPWNMFRFSFGNVQPFGL